MRVILIILSSIFFTVKAQTQLIITNIQGELSHQGEDLVFTASTSSAHKLQITSEYDGVTLHLPEGSYIKILTDKVIRYSDLIDQRETLSNTPQVQKNWLISELDEQTYAAFNSFIQSYGGLARLAFSEAQLHKLDSEPPLAIESRHETSNNMTPACSLARQRLANEGYGGFATFERCTRTARWANQLAAASVPVACFVPQPAEPVTCASALAALAVAISAHEDSRHSCRSSYNRGYRDTNDICYKNSGLSLCYDDTYLFDGQALGVSHGLFPVLQAAHDNRDRTGCAFVGAHYSVAQDMVEADPVGSFSIK